MAIGSFMGRTFTVSDRRIFTPSNLKGQSGSDWATHDRTGAQGAEPVDRPEAEVIQL